MDKLSGGLLLGSVDGSLIGGVQLVGGKKGKAIYTNGLDQWVNLGNQRANCMGNIENCNQGFVMIMWLRIHRYDDPGAYNDEYYITNGGHTERSMGVALLMREKNIVVYFRTASKVWELTYDTVPTLDTWYHVTMTWSLRYGGKIYINGMLGGEDNLGTNHVSNLDGNTHTTLLLGCDSTSPPDGAAQMTLDELRVFDIEFIDMYVWLMYSTDAQL